MRNLSYGPSIAADWVLDVERKGFESFDDILEDALKSCVARE